MKPVYEQGTNGDSYTGGHIKRLKDEFGLKLAI